MTLSRVLDQMVELTLADGKVIAGRLEHFPEGRSIVLFDDEEVDPIPLTVSAGEAPEATAALDEDHVLLRNWTEHRGVADQLVDCGLVGLTDEQVQVGMFRLQALVAKIVKGKPGLG